MKIRFLLMPFLGFSVVSSQTIVWQDTGGPYFGNIVALCVRADGITLAADRLPGQVYRSTNFGMEWERAGGMGFDLRSTFALRGDIAFAGTVANIVRSTDAGRTWSVAYTDTLPIGAEWYFSSFLFTVNGTALAANNGHGVFVSADSGQTWAHSNTLTPSDIVSLAMGAAGEINALTSGGVVYQSTNAGSTWTRRNVAPIGTPMKTLALSVNGSLIASSYGSGVFRSTDAGQIWAAVNNGLPNLNVNVVLSDVTGHLWAGIFGNGIFRSTNNGDFWSASSAGLDFPYIFSFAFIGGNNLLCGATGGVYSSTDGGEHWTQSSRGMANMDVLSVNFDRSDNIYAGSSGGMFVSTNAGGAWVRSSLPNGSVNDVAFTDGGMAYAAMDFGVYRSTNSGATWSLTTVPHPFAYSVLTSGSQTVYTGVNQGLFRSTDAGIAWTRLASGLFDGFVFPVIMSSSGTLFAAGDSGKVGRSTDGGNTWTSIPIEPTGGTVYELALHPSGSLFAGTYSGGVLRSTNNGNTWVHVGFRDTVVDAMAISPDGQILVGTVFGLMESTDEGATWSRQTNGLGDRWVRSLGIDSRGYAYAGTVRGVFRSAGPITSVHGMEQLHPETATLFQNYPNPFNPSTTITFSIPRSTFTKLTIFNILGKQIATLVNDNLNPGRYSKQWNPIDVASGVYYYRLQAGDLVQTKKLLLLR